MVWTMGRTLRSCKVNLILKQEVWQATSGNYCLAFFWNKWSSYAVSATADLQLIRAAASPNAEKCCFTKALFKRRRRLNCSTARQVSNNSTQPCLKTAWCDATLHVKQELFARFKCRPHWVTKKKWNSRSHFPHRQCNHQPPVTFGIEHRLPQITISHKSGLALRPASLGAVEGHGGS